MAPGTLDLGVERQNSAHSWWLGHGKRRLLKTPASPRETQRRTLTREDDSDSLDSICDREKIAHSKTEWRDGLLALYDDELRQIKGQLSFNKQWTTCRMMMMSGDKRARNLEYVHYSRVNESATSASSALAANACTEPTPSPDNAVATFKMIFGHLKSKVIAAVILITAIGVVAGAITMALFLRGRHSSSADPLPVNQSSVTTASVGLTSSSSSSTTAVTSSSSTTAVTSSPSTTAVTSSSSSSTTAVTSSLPTTAVTSSPSTTAVTSSPSTTAVTSSSSTTAVTSVSSMVATTTVKLTTSSCQSDEFVCSNLACVSLELVCNGIPDCIDGSDEHASCACIDGQFQCPSGQCVPSSAVCDQHYDCLDKGDEAVCPDCAGFRCVSSNVCLWDRMSSRCDQVFDCVDFSDELNCESFPSRYRCSNGVSIHNSKVCDGLDDCGDNSDEQSCVCTKKRQFSCSNQPGKCIPSTWVCDGHPDCFPATDEDSCGVCPEGDFQCSDYTCVNNSLRCDGQMDCMVSGGDEDGCVELTPVNQLQVMLGGHMYSVCSDDWTEAHSEWVCNTLHSRSVLSTSSVRQVAQFSQFAVLKKTESAPSVRHFVVSDACQSEATVHIKCHDAGCGQRKVAFLESYIAGGNIAAPGKWPWVVSLAYLDKPICAGVLIGARWVLTAAHCVMFAVDTLHDYSKVPFYYTVRAGTVIIPGNGSSSGRHQSQDVRVSKIFLHPERSILENGGVDWDIALLLLQEDLVMSDFVQPLCLPSHAQVFPSASFCYLAGWGILSFRQHLRASHLRDTRMQMWSESRCSRNTVVGEKAVNTNSTICAGFLFGTPTACQGDSGGPLMCLDPVSGRYLLAGLVSRGSGQCGMSQPHARSNRFARVAMAVPWIDEILNR